MGRVSEAGGGRASGRGRAAILLVVLVAAVAIAWIGHRPADVPLPAVGQVAEPARPSPPPSPPWTQAQLSDLLSAIVRADANGLRAGDYRAGELRGALAARQTGKPVDAIADAAALALAHDYAAGRIRNRHRFNWYIDYAGPDAATMRRLIVAAREDQRLDTWLTGLLPDDADYRALRDALSATPEEDWQRRDRIKANMERHRWLPRDFGTAPDRLTINLPTYRLEVTRDGQTANSYRAVIGATDMPTPVLSAPVRQVIVNPDWIVPASIVRRSHLKPSAKYIFSRRPDGTLRVRQKPGAGNALGKVKIEFPNRLAIYFHDTPSRSLFGAEVRTFSHGCVRVQDIATLGRSIVANQARYDAAMASVQTRGFAPARAWRADIVYLTLVRSADGSLKDVGDPYRLDQAMAATLEGRKPRVPPPAVVIPPSPAAPTAIDPGVEVIDAVSANVGAPTTPE